MISLTVHDVTVADDGHVVSSEQVLLLQYSREAHRLDVVWVDEEERTTEGIQFNKPVVYTERRRETGRKESRKMKDEIGAV